MYLNYSQKSLYCWFFFFIWDYKIISETKVRVSKKNTLYISKAIANAVGIKEGDIVKLKVDVSKIVIEVAQKLFDLALKGSKFAKTTFEEFEKESEELQNEFFRET